MRRLDLKIHIVLKLLTDEKYQTKFSKLLGLLLLLSTFLLIIEPTNRENFRKIVFVTEIEFLCDTVDSYIDFPLGLNPLGLDSIVSVLYVISFWSIRCLLLLFIFTKNKTFSHIQVKILRLSMILNFICFVLFTSLPYGNFSSPMVKTYLPILLLYTSFITKISSPPWILMTLVGVTVIIYVAVVCGIL